MTEREELHMAICDLMGDMMLAEGLLRHQEENTRRYGPAAPVCLQRVLDYAHQHVEEILQLGGWPLGEKSGDNPEKTVDKTADLGYHINVPHVDA